MFSSDPLEKYIKVYPEDFVVEEVLPFELKDKGRYSYYLLEKKNRGTLEVIDEISRTTKVPAHKIGFAGIKDRRAITKQYISIEGKPIREIVKGDNWKLRFVGYHDKPLEIGDIKGNIFTVTIRNFREQAKLKEAIEFVRVYGFANYFGEQRFRRNFVLTKPIGKVLLEGNIREALRLYLTWHEEPFKRRKLLRLYGNWRAFLKEATHLSLREKLAIKALKKGESPEKTFKLLPKNVKLMMVFSYQSYLWNRILKRIVERYFSYFRVPFIIDKYISFYNKVERVDILKECIPYVSQEVLQEQENIPNFIREEIIRVIKEEGLLDRLDREIAGIKFFNSGERKISVIPIIKGIDFLRDRIVIKFFLDSGSYATVLLRKMIFWKG